MSSVLPSSFSWGFDPKIEDNNNDQSSKTANSQRCNDRFTNEKINQEALASLQSGASLKSKRKHTDEEQESNISTPRKVIHRKSDKFRVTKKEVSHKRSRVPRIIGQPLPTDRIIEVLDKKNLQHLLANLVNLHPEITQDLYRCAPKPTVSGAIDILSTKVDNILNDLPYKVDASSEYAFLRVKPLIEDFLSALSDYTLHFLPPVETQPSNSLEFLDEATNLLHKLPNFAKISNNYFKGLAYEQLSHTWCICLKEFIKGPNSANNAALLLLINNNWEAKLKKHNEESNNKLESVVEYFKEEVSWLNDEFADHSKASNNFSPHNSPLHSFKTKNLLNEFR